MRPTDRVVIVGVRTAKLVDPGAQKLRRLDGSHAVEVQHLVERSVQRALRGGAVVADNVINQRVIEDTELTH